MSGEIKKLFTSYLPIQITPPLAKAVVRMVNAYETKGTHPQAFNSPYLGLYPCLFLNSDRDAFFDLFNSSEKELTKLLSQVIDGRNIICGIRYNGIINELKNKYMQFFRQQSLKGINGIQARDVRQVISQLSLGENYRVATDPFNLFVTYIIHLILSSNLPKTVIQETSIKILMLLQWKFFTSLTNHRFKYKPDEEVMYAMYEKLTYKFDIKRYGSWRALLEARAIDFMTPGSTHYEGLKSYDDDKKIIYFITDVQTRIRNQINIITNEFMKARDEQIAIGSYSTVGTDIDGEKMIISSDTVFDSMCSNVYTDVLSVTRFLDDQNIKLISNLFNNILVSRFRSFLISVSELATKQHKSGKNKETTLVDGQQVDIGMQILIENIIQKSYRYVMTNGVDISSPIKVLTGIKDVYGSSRVNDQGIILVRASVSHLVDIMKVSSREATISSYRIGFILYIILLTFKYRR